jgi:hypothetical protein
VAGLSRTRNRGEKQAKDEENTGDMLYKGIAERTFERSFQLADHVVVKGARLVLGVPGFPWRFRLTKKFRKVPKDGRKCPIEATTS